MYLGTIVVRISNNSNEPYEVNPPTTEEMDEFITDIGGEVTFDLFALVTIPHIFSTGCWY